MNETATFFDTLVNCLKYPPHYDPRELTAPTAILWPDKGREWESLIPRLRTHLPVLTLGSYQPQERTGPAIWLRCMLGRALSDRLNPHVTPILYLPGIGADDLRLAWQRPRAIEPLAEFLFRGELWLNGEQQDWTVVDFFQNSQVGTGVTIRDDDFTKRAMRRVLSTICDLTILQLREEEPWKARDFERLEEANVRNLIALGESAELEFKSSSRWDLGEKRHNPLMEKIILKTVAGFLNSRQGGTLLIGVEDSGNICGIELDYPTFRNDQQDPDGYEQWLMRHLLNAFGYDFAPYIHINFYRENAGTVCKITVQPGPKPALVEESDKFGKKSHIFYLRTGNATNALDLPTAFEYARDRWC